MKHINVIEPSLSDANNNSTEKEEECVEGLAFASEAMQQTISEMREKIECWTSKVKASPTFNAYYVQTCQEFLGILHS